MASFLRGKQAGIQNDLSAGLDPDIFSLDHVARYGVNSQIGAIAYDPVQSLLAVGTNSSKFGNGQIYVYGQKGVCVTFQTPRKVSIKLLHFCADKLISFDAKNDIAVFSLETKQLLSSYTPPRQVTALLTDPTLDYAFIGMQNGEVMAYDLDRQRPAPFKIHNFWKERNNRAALIPVAALALHPRDIGTLLIGYADGAVVFSFKQNKPLNFFQHPGSSPHSGSVPRIGNPKLVQAVWHPSGTFFLTVYDDSKMVIWDPKAGRIVFEKNIQDYFSDPSQRRSSAQNVVLPTPIYRISWCSKLNPDDTGILIAGGVPSNSPTRGLLFVDLGPTPIYATSSWQVLAQHFGSPKAQYTLQTPPNSEAVDYCIIPRSSPHFAGSNDPIAVIALLAYGELYTTSFPSGRPISPTNQLHASLTFVHPFINKTSLAWVDRTRWLGMTEKRSQGPPILRGGAEGTYPIRSYKNRNILHTTHADGTIRIWDAGHGDEIENKAMIQVDVARAVGRFDDVEITSMSMSGATGELAVGLRTGEVIIFHWDRNKTFGREIPHTKAEAFGLEAIQDRSDPNVKEGLLPLTLLDHGRGRITALKISDVGFIAAGFEDGGFAVMDLRGPAVILENILDDFVKYTAKPSGHRRGGSVASLGRSDWPTVIEFSVMSLEGEPYSSILIIVGTELGRLITFKVIPESHGAYNVQFAGVSNLESKILSINPINADNGRPASASQSIVGELRTGLIVNGVLVVTTQAGIRVFKPTGSKGASKSFSDFLCYSANIAQYPDRGYTLLGVFGDGYARGYSLPSLKEIAAVKIDHILDVTRFQDAIVTPTGDIFGWSGPSEICVVNVWGTGQSLKPSNDKLFNSEALTPPRPTISNIQWIAGTQYVTPSDMDILIGGPNRPPSKRMIQQLQSEEAQRRAEGSSLDRSVSGGSSSSKQDEGYWAYMQRQVQERTERLNIMGDSMDKLEEASSGWADDVGNFISNQKKNAVKGLITSKLGF